MATNIYNSQNLIEAVNLLTHFRNPSMFLGQAQFNAFNFTYKPRKCHWAFLTNTFLFNSNISICWNSFTSSDAQLPWMYELTQDICKKKCVHSMYKDEKGIHINWSRAKFWNKIMFFYTQFSWEERETIYVDIYSSMWADELNAVIWAFVGSQKHCVWGCWS